MVRLFPSRRPHPDVRVPGRRARKDWQQRPSPLARYALVAYLVVVIDASLYPFIGWRDLGLGAYDYLSADWPPRLLSFDVFVNALGYAPLGFLGVLALHPRLRGFVAVSVATLLAGALSANLEAIQTFLPTRVASKVDLASNIVGAAIGASIAARAAHSLLDTGRVRAWRTRWFEADASRGLVLVGAWIAALVYPDLFVFGTGGLLKIVAPELTGDIATSFGWKDGADDIAAALRFQAADTVVSACALAGSGLLFQNLMWTGLRWRMRIGLVAAFVAVTVTVAALARDFLFDDIALWPPLTSGARLGLACACVVLAVATVVPRAVRWAIAMAALVSAVTLVNIFPESPYAAAVGLSWTRGRLMNFYGLASGLNLVWPWFAILYLLRHTMAAPRPEARGRRSLREPQAKRSL